MSDLPFEEDGLAGLPPELPRRRPGFLRRMAAGAWHVLSGFWFLLRRPSFWPLAALPTLLALLLVLAGIALGAFAIPWLETHVLPGRGKVAAGVGILLSLALYLGTVLAGAICGLAVALLLCAPILERLSRRVEAYVRVQVVEHAGGLKWEIAQAFRGALYFLFAAPLVFLLSLIPLLGPPLGLLWGAHSMAFQQTDMPLARRGMGFGQRRAWHRDRAAGELPPRARPHRGRDVDGARAGGGPGPARPPGAPPEIARAEGARNQGERLNRRSPVRPGARGDRHRHVQRLAIALHAECDLRPRFRSRDALAQLLGARDRLAADLHDDVAGFQPRLRRGGALVHLAHEQRPVGDLEVSGELAGQLLVRDAEPPGAFHEEPPPRAVDPLPHERLEGKHGRERRLGRHRRQLHPEVARLAGQGEALALLQGGGQPLGRSVAAHLDRHRPAGRRLADQAGELGGAAHGLAVEADDHVVGLEAGPGVGVDLFHEGAALVGQLQPRTLLAADVGQAHPQVDAAPCHAQGPDDRLADLALPRLLPRLLLGLVLRLVRSRHRRGCHQPRRCQDRRSNPPERSTRHSSLLRPGYLPLSACWTRERPEKSGILGRVEEKGWLRRRVVGPLGLMLRHGSTPERVAISLALGAALGLFPIVGTSTLLCFAAALAFRLNHPAIQLANYLMYPFQIPFILLYVRFGEALLASPPVPFDPRMLAVSLRADPAAFFARFGLAAGHAVVGWSAAAPFLVGTLYAAVLPLLRRVRAQWSLSPRPER
ncbi:MAG: hypothetical protein DMF80_03115 [Acidobacteria bacterium]|nr:MAG: hypothetical protein DMF80_03115 [Acidobacteriota bacterium]